MLISRTPNDNIKSSLSALHYVENTFKKIYEDNKKLKEDLEYIKEILEEFVINCDKVRTKNNIFQKIIYSTKHYNNYYDYCKSVEKLYNLYKELK